MAALKTDHPAHPFGCPAGEPQALSPLYSQLRTERPVSRVRLASGEVVWLAASHAATRRVLLGREFSRYQARQVAGYPDLDGFILGLDGADHLRVRGVVQNEFLPHNVGQWAELVDATVTEMLDSLLDSGAPADIVSGLALPVALGTITSVLGVPAEDRPQFRRWGDAFLSTAHLTHDPEQSATAVIEMAIYLGGLISERRTQAAGDLLSVIAQGDASDDELVRLAVALVTAGWETTAAAIAGSVLTFLTTGTDAPLGDVPQGQTPLYQHLTTHPEDIHPAVEEYLRLVPIAGADTLPRRATQDVELEGVLIRAGDLVIPAHPSGNHDETVFADPHCFRLSRDTTMHMGFGYGPHHCVGAHLARLELRTVHQMLTERLPGLRLAVPANEVKWSSSTSIRVPEELPVTW